MSLNWPRIAFIAANAAFWAVVVAAAVAVLR